MKAPTVILLSKPRSQMFLSARMVRRITLWVPQTGAMSRRCGVIIKGEQALRCGYRHSLMIELPKSSIVETLGSLESSLSRHALDSLPKYHKNIHHTLSLSCSLERSLALSLRWKRQ